MDLLKNFLNKLRTDRKTAIVCALAALVVVLLIVMIFSGNQQDESTQTDDILGDLNAEESGELSLNQDQKVPASQRYDYTNLLSQDYQPADPAEDPFAGMKQGSDTTPDSSAPDTKAAPPAQEPAPVDTAGQPSDAWLYCDSFASEALASEQKALVAFQGLSSHVVASENNSYQLKIGPFPDREFARSEFNRLGEAGLVSRCSLVEEPRAE